MTTDVAGHVPAVTLGLRMYMALRDSKISHQEMADYLGVARTSITRWTHDTVQPGRATLVAWSLKTGVPLEWIEHGTAPHNGGDGDDGLPRLDSNQQPSGLRPRLHLPALLPLLAA